jgi:hypothetical protein
VRQRPFFRSRPGRGLSWASAAVAALTVALPYTPIAEPLGLDGLPAWLVGTLALLIGLNVAANELAKRRLGDVVAGSPAGRPGTPAGAGIEPGDATVPAVAPPAERVR